MHAESLAPGFWSVNEFKDFAKRKQELGVNQETFLSEKAEVGPDCILNGLNSFSRNW